MRPLRSSREQFVISPPKGDCGCVAIGLAYRGVNRDSHVDSRVGRCKTKSRKRKRKTDMATKIDFSYVRSKRKNGKKNYKRFYRC